MAISATNSLSLRLFYKENTALATGIKRKEETKGALSMADARALRNGIRRLQDYDFEEGTDDAVQEKLQAFVDTYNNTLQTGKSYAPNDTAIKNAVNKMKSLTKEKADDLSDIGISVDSKTGLMSLSGSAGKNISKNKFTDFFSKDSEYLSGLYASARHMTNKIDIRL